MYISVKSQKSIPEKIFQQIRESITDGSYVPGQKLPTERELTEQFQASRLAVREALKSLQASGLIVVRRGSGIYVNDSSQTALVESFSTLLKFRKASLSDLTEARKLFEPAIAQHACTTITEDDLQRLRKNIREASSMLERGMLATQFNIEFHAIIADATHNPIIATTMGTLFEILTELTLEVVTDSVENLTRSKLAVKEHLGILSALEEKDVTSAYSLSLLHVEMVQKDLARLHPEARRVRTSKQT